MGTVNDALRVHAIRMLLAAAESTGTTKTTRLSLRRSRGS
jgi:hypothetical protein